MKSTKTANLRRLLKYLHIGQALAQNPNSSIDTLLQEQREISLSSRRKFLENFGTAGAGMIILPSIVSLSGCGNKVEEPTTEVETKVSKLQVAIIGGGMAGLNCSYQLRKQGISSHIFDASFRLGGRIHTHYRDALENGVFPELGGEFIDSDHEDMLLLTKEFGLELIDLVDEMDKEKLTADKFYINGKSYTEKEVIKEFAKCSKQIAKDASSLGDDYDTEDAERLDKISLRDYLDKLPIAQWLKDILGYAYIAEFGLEPEEQSSLNFLDMIETDTSDGFKVFGTSDERYRIKGGNSKLIEAMAEKIGVDAYTLDTKLTALADSESGYLLEFDDGTKVEAEYVVLTLPFTKLRDVKMSLKNMSEDKKKCIAELGYGNNTKLVLSYNGRPWREGKNKSMGYLYNDLMCNGWDSSYFKSSDDNAGAYIGFLGGKVSAEMSSKSFAHPRAPKSHVWKTQLPPEEVDKFVTVLDGAFPGSKAKFTQKSMFADWNSVPYVNGSYSAYKVGQWSTISGFEQESIDNVLFAGEHTSSDFQGFMNGAAESGRVAAEQIVEKQKKSVPEPELEEAVK